MTWRLPHVTQDINSHLSTSNHGKPSSHAVSLLFTLNVQITCPQEAVLKKSCAFWQRQNLKIHLMFWRLYYRLLCSSMFQTVLHKTALFVWAALQSHLQWNTASADICVTKNSDWFTFHYQLMHLLIKTLSQFTFKTTHIKMSVMRT